MKSKTIFVLSCIMGLIFLSCHCDAQIGSCADNYEEALRLYNYGMADSALNTLKPCLENKQALKQVSKATAANIYRLAALSSILVGNTQDADHYITQLLKYQPDYRDNIREDDLEEFRLILNSKSALPELSVGIRAGINIPLLSLEKNFTDPIKTAATYTQDGSSGFQLGLTAEKAFTKSIAIEAGVGMTMINFNYLVRSSLTGQYQYDQGITYIEIPVLARYYPVPNSSLQPYLQAGAAGKFSLYVREKSDDFGKYWLTESHNSDNILATFLTSMENIGLVVGGGVCYNLKSFRIRADIRYTHHLNSSGRISKFDNISSYEDIPDGEAFGYTNDISLITLKDLQVAVGLAYNLKYKVF